ncbi:hypothetical protein ILUMI_18381 [Ignelater luminosus]|uniref:Uncharacterized protein n=1 Tax=Ignelater luminosus TaxID=2038154 RepID=A0A8K0CM75_IGNLU|nr:hypothetical protein ILUMI_18381 [Ignelater luminosus]
MQIIGEATVGIPESVQAALPSVIAISKTAQRTNPAPPAPILLSKLVIDDSYSKTSSGEDSLLFNSEAC